MKRDLMKEVSLIESEGVCCTVRASANGRGTNRDLYSIYL